jgi:hypothetical protein
MPAKLAMNHNRRSGNRKCISRPNVAMIRAYGWRVGCSAAGVTDAGVGSVGWFGGFIT